jgi:DNA-binding NtrC family response regulator
LGTQAKLLRVLESGDVLRLGARAPVKVDVRFVAATNRDLRAQIAAGAFRSDLFFRLNGMSVTIPPLRKRPSEIAPLARAFAARTAARLGRLAAAFDAGAMSALEAYAWPGNVRELRNVVERATVVGGNVVTCETLAVACPEVLAPAMPAAGDASHVSATQQLAALADPTDLKQALHVAEKQRVLDALAKSNGNQARAAELLGISRRTLINRIESYGIGRPRKG